MDLYRLISLICLCVVNGFFTLAGIFLNSVVIISLWKSSQLRRKTCYFMILVLSCFDRGHGRTSDDDTPICCLVFWRRQKNVRNRREPTAHLLDSRRIRFLCIAHNEHWSISHFTSFAIWHPFLYQARVTKRRLLKPMLLIQLLCLVVPIMYSIPQLKKLVYIIVPLLIAIALSLIFFMNCRILLITRKKRRATHSTTKPTPVTKRKSPCSLVIACFFICRTPLILYNVFVAISTIHQDLTIFWLWAATAAAMSSSLDCLIFAWRNRFLYTEMKKTLTGFKNFTCWTICGWKDNTS